MAYDDNPVQVKYEAISIVDGKTFQVIQIADSTGTIVDPAQGSVVFDGEVTIDNEVEIKNDSGNPERQGFAGFNVGHFSLQGSRAGLRHGGVRLKQHRKQKRSNADEGTEDGAGRFDAAGWVGVCGKGRFGLWRHESRSHTGFSAAI